MEKTRGPLPEVIICRSNMVRTSNPKPSTEAPKETVTGLLSAMRAGQSDALSRLMPIIYEDLRRVAHRRLQSERLGHTLNTTALVHETYVRLVDQRWTQVQDRAHFFAIAARAMRRILVSYARQHNAEKRYGQAQRVPLDDMLDQPELSVDRADELLMLDAALTDLEAFNERGCRVVEYRVFAGLSHDEIAELMGLSVVTVRRAWSLAKMWLKSELQQQR